MAFLLRFRLAVEYNAFGLHNMRYVQQIICFHVNYVSVGPPNSRLSAFIKVNVAEPILSFVLDLEWQAVMNYVLRISIAYNLKV